MNGENDPIGDYVFFVALIPFCLWLGAWGIIPAFVVGTIANIWEDGIDE